MTTPTSPPTDHLRVRARRTTRYAVLAGLALTAGTAAGCAPSAQNSAPASTGAPATQDVAGSGLRPPDDPDATATLAFAGDVHFEGVSERALDEGLGSASRLLEAADLSVVNLESAVTSSAAAEPKKYTFKAPPEALDALTDAGVDAVTIANNHGMDFGLPGLRDTLQAARDASVPVLGAGTDQEQAFAPLRRTLQGIDVSVLAATDVLDSFAVESWDAGPQRAGLASSKDPERLLSAVRAEAARSDVVVVYMHWGRELRQCPTDRQRLLARELASAGADLVVGSHAHVPQPGEWVDDTYVHYGLGNFVFYASKEATTRSGVLTVEVDADGVVETDWHPATIVDGLPELQPADAGTSTPPGPSALVC